LRGEERSTLDSDVLFDPSKVKIEDTIYKIIGTAHHTGGILTGHWITKIKLKDTSWWLLDSLKTFAQRTISSGLQADKFLSFSITYEIKMMLLVIFSSCISLWQRRPWRHS
jgi:hypothetical protein